MSNSAPDPTDNLSDSYSSILVEDAFLAPVLQALQVGGITRGCSVVDDASFVRLAITRALQNSKTGRDFIQTHGIPTTAGLTRSNYFGSLSSTRRLGMMIPLAIANGTYTIGWIIDPEGTATQNEGLIVLDQQGGGQERKMEYTPQTKRPP